MRLLDTSCAAAPGREPGKHSNPVVRAAVLSGCVVFLCGVLLLSPLFRVTTVVWTGSVVLDPARCVAIERASLGQSLLLLPDRLLRSQLHETERLAVQFKKHFPNTLEVSVVSRLAVAVDENGSVFDRSGRALPSSHADPGLPQLVGFRVHDGGLEPVGARVLAALDELRTLPALRTERVERRGDDVEFVLARTQTLVRMRIAAFDVQVHKLRLFEQSLGTAELPAVIDLRFRDQVVVRAQRDERQGGAHEDG